MKLTVFALFLAISCLYAGFVRAEATSTTSTPVEFNSSSIQNAINEATSTIEKARQITNNISNAASAAQKFYEQSRSVIDSAYAVVTRGQEIYQRLQPKIAEVQTFWDNISNHNDRTRVILIIGAVAVVALIIHFI